MKIQYYLTLILSFSVFLLTAQITFPPPYNLQYQLVGEDVNLSWSPPDTSSNFYLSWDNGNNGNAIGFTGGGTFSVAARWDPSQISEYAGQSISKASFFFTGPESIYSLRIWKGPDADTLIYTQDINNPVLNDWSFVYLNNPIALDVSEDLWVGYEVSQPAGDFPAGTDFGPAVAGYGDMLYFEDQWISIAQLYGLDINWNIRVYLSDEPGSPDASINPLVAYNKSKSTSGSLKAIKTSGKPFPMSPESTNGLLGYNIYKNGIQLNTDPIPDTTVTDFAVPAGLYEYGVSAVYEDGESIQATINVQIGEPEVIIEPEAINLIGFPNFVFEEIVTIYNEGNVDLIWVAIPSAYWVSIVPQNGIIAPGNGFDLELLINTSGLIAGIYETEILFVTNSSTTPTITLPVTLEIIGAPGIAVYPEELGFGDVNLGSTSTLALTVTNIGTDLLEIFSIESTNELFVIDGNIDQLAAGESETIFVSFTPLELGEFTGQILITSNDGINPTLTVEMNGYAQLEPPAYLIATASGDDVDLTWQMDANGEGDWVHWDSGENFDAIGYTGGATFQYAARWTPEQLAPFTGKLVPKVAFFPRGENTSYTLKVWKGDNASVNIISQPVTNFQVNEWNEVFLEIPFQVDPFQELWVGFEVTHPEGDYPAGTDKGPAVFEFGDMIYFEGTWLSMGATFGLSYNWNLQFFVLESDSTYQPVAVNEIIEEPASIDSQGTLSLGKLEKLQGSNPVFLNPNAELLGYNVYRNNEQLNEALLSEETFLDINPPIGTFEYGVTAVYPEGESGQTQTLFQVGAPVITFNPSSISDTLDACEVVEHVVEISNSGNLELQWFADPNAYWITLSETSGTLAPGESSEMIVTINSSGLFGGNVNSLIVFETNSLNAPVSSLPVTLLINGSAQLILTPDTLDFGVKAINTTKTAYISIINAGNEAVYITEMVTSPDVFTSNSFPVYLFPGGTIILGIFFTPESIGDFAGEFSVLTNDPENPVYTSVLLGSSQLPKPVNLTATVDTTTVFLDWQQPLGGPGNYLQYSGDESYTAIGFTGGGSFAVAAKFGPDQLMNFNGNAITSIGFIPWTDSATYTLKVWMGENAEDLMLEQTVESVEILAWNDILLEMPVPVDSASYIWLGYEVTHEIDDFPAGCDFGPSTPGFSDLITTDGITWESLSYYGLDFNWNIRGYVDIEGESVALSALPKNNERYENSGNLKEIVSPENSPMKAGAMTLNFLGYNVYRDGVALNEGELLSISEYLDLELQPGIYNYEVTAVYDMGESMPAGPVEVEIIEPLNLPLGWGHNHTAMTHLIHVPTETAADNSFMSAGDWIGVFYNDGGIEKSAGAITWAEADSLKLIAYGDDPATPQKEGLAIGEWMKWKVFMAETGDEFEISVSYNPMLPQWDGMFAMLGESALTDISLLPTSVSETEDFKISIFPNPATEKVTIYGIEKISQLKIINAFGREIENRKLNGQQTVEIETPWETGLYYLILTGEETLTRKLIIY